MSHIDSNPSLRPVQRSTAFSMAGVLYGLTTLFLAVGAVNGQNNLLFWAFGMALGGLLVSGLFSGSGMMGLRVSREVPTTARAGESMVIRYTIRNANRIMPLFCVTLTERTRERRAKGSGRDSTSGTARPAVCFLPSAGARATVTLDAPTMPLVRGRLALTGLTASSSFPLGLMRKTMTFDLVASVLVLPVRLDVRDDLVPAPARRGQGGAASPTSIGHADEIFGIREYMPGDSPRLIAWRPSARSDTLVVRQQGSPPPTIAWVLLELPGMAASGQGSGDAAGAMLEAERAIALAASLIELLARRGLSVGLFIDRSGVARAPAAGAWHARRLVWLLATLDLSKPPVPGVARSMPRIRREHAAIAISASDSTPESSVVPSWARRLSAADLGSCLKAGAEIPACLLPPAPPETTEQRRRRLFREFFMVDPVGEPAMGSLVEAAPARAGGEP